MIFLICCNSKKKRFLDTLDKEMFIYVKDLSLNFNCQYLVRVSEKGQQSNATQTLVGFFFKTLKLN